MNNNNEEFNNNKNNTNYKDIFNKHIINKNRGCQICRFIHFFSFIKK